MTYRGVMKGGVVVLDGPELPPDGSVVTVDTEHAQLTDDEKNHLARQRQGLARLIELGKEIGQVLPTDASQNVDHYLYGAPRR